mmetsp:Transcript_29513/g.44873  ORF Transcript_29513/g.44873 Transcript_29513/m.44873 type:complete len:117 (+) Transcript_29513:225-575(+)
MIPTTDHTAQKFNETCPEGYLFLVDILHARTIDAFWKVKLRMKALEALRRLVDDQGSESIAILLQHKQSFLQFMSGFLKSMIGNYSGQKPIFMKFLDLLFAFQEQDFPVFHRVVVK